MAHDYAGVRKTEQLLKPAAADFGGNANTDMYKPPPQLVGDYTEQDARATHKLAQA